MFVIRSLLANSASGTSFDTFDLADFLAPSTFWNRGGGRVCVGSSTVTSSRAAIPLSGLE